MKRFFLLLAALTSPVFAQTDWPARPVTLINPFAAASAVDVVARLVAQRMTQNTGKSFLVENRTGASGNIGTEAAAKAKPDGYTFLVGSPGSMAINPYLFKKLPYDAEKDFVAVTTLASFPQVLIVNPKVPANTLSELVVYSKSHPVRYGSGGTGGVLHIAGEMLKLKSGGNFVHVPYRGGAQAATDAISGQIEMVSMGLASTRVAEGGQLRILAQAGPSRHPMLPDVPTTAEAGLPDVRMETWFGMAGPPGMPKEHVARVNRELAVIARQPAIEIPPHAHAAFQIHVVMAYPVAKADGLDLQSIPFVKGDELMPVGRRRRNRQAAIVARHRKIAGEAFKPKLGGEELRIVEALNMD